MFSCVLPKDCRHLERVETLPSKDRLFTETRSAHLGSHTHTNADKVVFSPLIGMCSRFLCLSQRKRAYAVLFFPLPSSHTQLVRNWVSGRAREGKREGGMEMGRGCVCPFAYVMVEKNVENVECKPQCNPNSISYLLPLKDTLDGPQ